MSSPSPVTNARIQSGLTSQAPNGAVPGARIGDEFIHNDLSADGSWCWRSVLSQGEGNAGQTMGRTYPNGRTIYPGGPGSSVVTVNAVIENILAIDCAAAGPPSSGGKLPVGVYVFTGPLLITNAPGALGGWGIPAMGIRVDSTGTPKFIGSLTGVGLQADGALAGITLYQTISGTVVTLQAQGVAAQTLTWYWNVAMSYSPVP